MKKVIVNIIFLVVLSLIFNSSVSVAQENDSSEPVPIYLFYSKTCPHCEEEREFLTRLAADKSDFFVLTEYEVTGNRANSGLFEKVAELVKSPAKGVPYLVIGDKPIVGYLSDETTGKQIDERINNCRLSSCPNEVGKLLGVDAMPASLSPTPAPAPVLVELPLIGILNVANYPLVVVTIIIGFLDGFNPCAMWILLFLITLILKMKDRKRMWILGGTFILVSGVTYFAFLAAWLNVFLFLSYVSIIRYIVGFVAITSGLLSLRKYYLERNGCSTIGDSKRERIFEKLKAITQNKSFIFALVGMVGLAVSVNMLELVCSAGLPAIYTNVLSMSDLNPLSYYGYLVLYILLYMLDDLAVFVIAMVTLQVTGISTKYTRLTNLIGGIIILIIGLLLLLKPQALMFS